MKNRKRKKEYSPEVMAAANDAVEKIIPILDKIQAKLSLAAFKQFDAGGFNAMQMKPEQVERFMIEFIKRAYTPRFHQHEYAIRLRAVQVSQTVIEVRGDNLQTFVTLAGLDIPPPLAEIKDATEWTGQNHKYIFENGEGKIYKIANRITFTATIDPDALKKLFNAD